MTPREYWGWPGWVPTRDEVLKHLVLAAIVGAAAVAVHRYMR